MDIEVIKVCHITMLYSPYFSGHGLYLEKVFKYFPEMGVRNFVITSNYGGLKRKELVDGVPIYRVKIRKHWKRYVFLFSLQAIRRLYNKLASPPHLQYPPSFSIRVL